MHCNRVAIAGMLKQGGGRVWNMEGFGSNGQTMPKYGPYGATKYALKYFTKVMVKEYKDTPVEICYLSPGMVLTDMLASAEIRSGESWSVSTRITVSARACESCQFDGNWSVLIGTLSVWP